MSSCVAQGNCVAVRNYTKKDGSAACVVQVSCGSDVLEFFGRRHFPEFPFGTVVRIGFDIGVFNGKPSSLRLVEMEEVKK